MFHDCRMRDLLLKNLCPRFAPLAVIAVAAVALVSCADASHTIDATSEKRARIIIAEDTRTISDELLGYLDDPEPAVRALACRAVGRIGVADRSDSEIVEILWPHLQDTSAQVVTSVVFAFGLLPDNAELANRLVEFAMTAPPDAAHAALVSAGRIGDSASVPLLQKLTIFLNHQRPGYRSRAALALFLAGFTGSGDALSQVALGDSVKTVRDTALYALVRLRDTRARDVYLSYLDDPDDYLQALAARGLAAVADTLLVPRLSVLLQGADPNLRSQVITSLSSLKCAASEKALAWRAENETDERLAAQALRALAQYDNQAHRRLALDRIAEDNSLEMDAAIVAYLSGTLRRNTDRELEVLVASGDERLAEVFLNSLNRSLEKRKLKALIQRRLRDAPGPAHYAAYALCREINLELDDWMTSARLAKILKQGGDPLIVAAALEHAGHRREPWFFDAALSLARNPEKIPAQNRQDVFLSILDAAESMLADEAEPSEQARVNAREVFEKCLAMADFTISARAAEALKENFAEDRGSEIVKPQSLYTASELAHEIEEARTSSSEVVISLPKGDVTIDLDYDAAPLTCLNFTQLIKDGFYENLVFHRVIPNFVAQGGDPRGDGWGGPGYNIRCEYSERSYKRGTVGIATSGKDTGGSQFFITLSAQPHLDARYTIIGEVASGMEHVDGILRGDVARSISIAAAVQ